MKETELEMNILLVERTVISLMENKRNIVKKMMRQLRQIVFHSFQVNDTYTCC